MEKYIIHQYEGSPIALFAEFYTKERYAQVPSCENQTGAFINLSNFENEADKINQPDIAIFVKEYLQGKTHLFDIYSHVRIFVAHVVLTKFSDFSFEFNDYNKFIGIFVQDGKENQSGTSTYRSFGFNRTTEGAGEICDRSEEIEVITSYLSVIQDHHNKFVIMKQTEEIQKELNEK